MTPRPTPNALSVDARFDLIGSLRGLIGLVRDGLDAVRRARAHAALRASVDPAVLRDMAMSAEDATGTGSHQPALPFFMQAGFGARD